MTATVLKEVEETRKNFSREALLAFQNFLTVFWPSEGEQGASRTIQSLCMFCTHWSGVLNLLNEFKSQVQRSWLAQASVIVDKVASCFHVDKEWR